MTAIIPFSPGGGTDRSVRLVTPSWSGTLGADTFMLDHKPGAGSLIAQNQLQSAAHDAHTVLFTPPPTRHGCPSLRPTGSSSIRSPG